MGRKDDRIKELEAELAKVKGTNTVLEGWRNAWLAGFKNEDQRITIQTTMAALTDLWEMVGAEHQTGAVMAIKKLVEDSRFIRKHRQRELDHNQVTASLRQRITELESDKRSLTFHRDSAVQSLHDQSYDFANTKARVEELETVVSGALVALAGEDITARADAAHAVGMLTEVLGDEK